MKKRLLTRVRVLAVLVALFPGCLHSGDGNTGQTDLLVHAIYADTHCDTQESDLAVRWVDDPSTLRQVLAPGQRHVLGAGKPALPEVDFQRNMVLLVSMGQQPSAGYGFDVSRLSATVENHTAVVRLTPVAPPPGALTAQVMTHPCILIRVPRGDYSRIRVVDPNGEILGDVAAPIN